MQQNRFKSGRLIDLALILAAAILLAPIAYVGLHPVFAPPRPVAEKYTLRAGPIGLRAAAAGAR